MAVVIQPLHQIGRGEGKEKEKETPTRKTLAFAHIELIDQTLVM